MSDELKQFIDEQLHNEKVRKNIKKLNKKEKFLDEDGKEIVLGYSVNYEVVKK